MKLLLALVMFMSSSILNASDEKAAVGQVLDSFHQAASKADGDKYFGLFSKNGVFIGTDASERWTVKEFRAYAKPHFDQGKGWTYRSTKRNIDLAKGGNMAWFDELLENSNYGTCRGTGVLVKESGKWKISQYHLTIPVPNKLAKTLVGLIRGEISLPKGK